MPSLIESTFLWDISFYLVLIVFSLMCLLGDSIKSWSATALSSLTTRRSSSGSSSNQGPVNNFTTQSVSVQNNRNSSQFGPEVSTSSCVSSSTGVDSVNSNPGQSKRTDYLVWWDYFLSVAYIASLRSKDPRHQLGACIVNQQNRIVSVGYNGMPNRCSDDDLPWNSGPEDSQNHHYHSAYVCHAEMNAILNKTSYDLCGCTIFVLQFPCNECAKLIIQAGISRVVFCGAEPPKDNVPVELGAAMVLFRMAKVAMVQYIPDRRKIEIDFNRFIEK